MSAAATKVTDADAGLRTKYQAEIEKAKKLESANATLTKKNTMLSGEIEILKKQLLTMQEQKDLALEIARRAKEEAVHVRSEELTKREEMAHSMQKVAADVGDKLDKFVEENKATAAENDMLRKKIEEMGKAFDSIKGKYEEALRIKDDERKSGEEHIIQSVHAVVGKSEAMINELKRELQQSQAREKAAKSELDAYTSKFAEIQIMVENTSGVIQAQKKEQAKLLDLLKDSEADRKTLLQRCVKSETDLLNITKDTKALLEKHEAQLQVVEKLKGLSRALQTERNQLHTSFTDLKKQVANFTEASKTVAAGSALAAILGEHDFSAVASLPADADAADAAKEALSNIASSLKSSTA